MYAAPTVDVRTTDGQSFRELIGSVVPRDWVGETMVEFRKFAGTIMTRAVRSVLGRPGLYTASQEYLARKLQNPYVYQPETGAGAGAPLILTGRMYKAIHVYLEHDYAILAILPPAGGVPAWKALQFQRQKETSGASAEPARPKAQRTLRERLDADAKYQMARASLMEYSLKWEHETKFFEQGVEESIPDLETLFGQLAEWVLGRAGNKLFEYQKDWDKNIANWLASTEGGYFAADY